MFAKLRKLACLCFAKTFLFEKKRITFKYVCGFAFGTLEELLNSLDKNSFKREIRNVYLVLSLQFFRSAATTLSKRVGEKVSEYHTPLKTGMGTPYGGSSYGLNSTDTHDGLAGMVGDEASVVNSITMGTSADQVRSQSLFVYIFIVHIDQKTTRDDGVVKSVRLYEPAF